MALACPILVRNCQRHGRFEWYDPINKVGGIALTFSSLQQQLKKRFFCKQCKLYHVESVAVIIDEDFALQKYRLKEVDFDDFVEALDWSEVNGC
jgi:hypothetical protein